VIFSGTGFRRRRIASLIKPRRLMTAVGLGRAKTRKLGAPPLLRTRLASRCRGLPPDKTICYSAMK
jgi:hypothetical protein